MRSVEVADARFKQCHAPFAWRLVSGGWELETKGLGKVEECRASIFPQKCQLGE